MADAIPAKWKLKQACLPFAKVKSPTEDKENNRNVINIFDNSTDNSTEVSLLEKKCGDGVLFKPIPRKTCKKNKPRHHMLQVKVDVHQTIQCPEVSTSTSSNEETDPEHTADDIIDLTEESVCSEDPKPSTLSSEVSKNIDDVIDCVIQRGITDGADMVKNRDQMRETKKRHSQPLDTCPQSGDHFSSNGMTDVFNSASDPRTAKKPRRSILDMLTVTSKSPSVTTIARESENDIQICEQQESTTKSADESINVDNTTDTLTSDARKRVRAKSPTKDSVDDVEQIAVGSVDSGSRDTNITSAPNQTEEEDTAQVAKKPRTLSPSSEDAVSNADALVTTEDHNPVAAHSSSTDNSTNPVNNSPPSNKKNSPSQTKSKSASKTSAEAQKIKQEREKEREEKRLQKEREKQVREMEKLEMKRKKEEQRQQKEDEKRKKREELEREKEEKQKKRQEEFERKKADLEFKRKVKELKEEQKRKEREEREAEKRVREEERQKFLDEKAKMDEEKKRISEKRAATFKNFFISTPGKSTQVHQPVEKCVGSFVPFQLKEDMFLPPKPKRLNAEAVAVLDELLCKQTHPQTLYLKEIKRSEDVGRLSRTISKTNSKKPLLSLSEDGLEVVTAGDAAHSINIRAKLLQFSENNRPPYYGTWRKASKFLTARNPLKQDKDLLDYDVDSDDEWEDPGEGEDIDHSDGEEEGEKDEEEDDGDGFFVPHGYLSDDEGIVEEDADDEIEEERSDQKLKMKQQEFENSFKRKIKAMTPVTIGCVWDDLEGSSLTSGRSFLRKFEAQFFLPAPIDLNVAIPKLTNNATTTAASSKKSVPEEAIPDLVRMLHGNPHSLGRLVPEFQTYWLKKKSSDTATSSCQSQQENLQLPTQMAQPPVSQLYDKGPFWISKTQLNKRIKEIGVYGRKPNLTRACWMVIESVFEKYSLNPDDYPVPCNWDYLTFEPDLKLYPAEIPQITVAPPSSSSDTPPKISIDKFATKVSAEDLLEQSNARLKQEKEKQVQQQSLQAVNKFTTVKIQPEELLEKSRQKLEEEQVKQKRRIPLTTISLADDENIEASPPSFGVPTHAAFKSFFKVKEPGTPSNSATAHVEVLEKINSVLKTPSKSVDVSVEEANAAVSSAKSTEATQHQKPMESKNDKEVDHEIAMDVDSTKCSPKQVE